jgi:hypothetical protein
VVLVEIVPPVAILFFIGGYALLLLFIWKDPACLRPHSSLYIYTTPLLEGWVVADGGGGCLGLCGSE